jgi:CRP/FNR family nitrogen fixation transcriptional regulator
MHACAVQPVSTAPRGPFCPDVVRYDRRPASGDAPGVRMSYARDEEIFGDGESARNVYRVLSGAVRTYRMLADGRRQIVEFHLPGDLFGLDGDVRHNLGAEAVCETAVQIVRRETYLGDQGEGQPGAMAALLKTFQRTQDHLLLLGRHTACERVASFLLDFQRRTGQAILELPMSRQDIADYLGLTIETVSRTISQLQQASLIDLLSSRKVILRSAAALRRICQ